jgi:NADP-dependent 3-hydroxy acid dehydrogenase YdfG
VISGGGRGVGRLMAVELAGAGAAIGLIARSGAELAAVAARIEQSGGTAAVAELARRHGPANLLINNAGVSGPAGQLWDVRPAEWWRAIRVDFGGAFTLTRLALPDMIAA